MKHNIPLLMLPMIALVAVNARLAVTVGTDGGCKPAQAGDAVVGFSGPYDVAAGNAVDVVTAGVIPVLFSEAVVAGDKVKVGADGQLVKAADLASAIGVAAEDCAANEVGSIYRL